MPIIDRAFVVALQVALCQHDVTRVSYVAQDARHMTVLTYVLRQDVVAPAGDDGSGGDVDATPVVFCHVFAAASQVRFRNK